jgi:hypothetical protein
VPVNILALIAAFSTSIGFGLTVFHTGWHCPILHVFTDMRFNELLEFLSSTVLKAQNGTHEIWFTRSIPSSSESSK